MNESKWIECDGNCSLWPKIECAPTNPKSEAIINTWEKLVKMKHEDISQVFLLATLIENKEVPIAKDIEKEIKWSKIALINYIKNL